MPDEHYPDDPGKADDDNQIAEEANPAKQAWQGNVPPDEGDTDTAEQDRLL